MRPERIHTTYEVGTTCYSIVDETRKELLGPAQGNRKIAIRMHYPVAKEAVQGMPKGQYFSCRKMEAVRKAFAIPKSATMDNTMDYYENAPMIEGEKFPLLLFSHGYNSYLEANTYLCNEIAASGYIVASVGHAYEAVETDYEDGSYDYFDKTINKRMYQKGVFSAFRAQGKLLKKKGSVEEIYDAFLLFQAEHTPYLTERLPEWKADMLCALASVKERFGAYLDLTNGVAASGHSFGGATAYALCLSEPEISCGLNIDGALFGDFAGTELTKPFYQMACKENWNVESGVLLRRTVPVHTAIFSDMKHIGFTDAKFLMSSKMLMGKLDAQIMHEQLTQCHVAFLDKYLKKQEADLEKKVDSLVALQTIL